MNVEDLVISFIPCCGNFNGPVDGHDTTCARGAVLHELGRIAELEKQLAESRSGGCGMDHPTDRLSREAVNERIAALEALVQAIAEAHTVVCWRNRAPGVFNPLEEQYFNFELVRQAAALAGRKS